MSKDFSQGDKVKFMAAKEQRKPLLVGAGQRTGTVTLTHNGETATLKENQVYQVSMNTAAEILNDGHGPLPLINGNYLNKSPLKARFKRVQSGNKSTIKNNENDE